MTQQQARGAEPTVVLWWIPVGAGSAISPHTSRAWERIDAALHRRPAQQLLHAGLEITAASGEVTVIEMAPAWQMPRHTPRGVVAQGPVGASGLGRWRAFRYEVRCWRGGSIPDTQWAVSSVPVTCPDPAGLERLTHEVAQVPRHVWGRHMHGVADMWNSNSLIAWLLTTCGVDATDLGPPVGSRAPGWDVGIVCARMRHSAS